MGTPFLTNLGITPIQQARTPTTAVFPSALNANNKFEWEQAVQDLVPSDDTTVDWVKCVRRYVELCELRGVYPFQNVQQSRNDQITDFFKDRRQQLVRFVNHSKFFESIKIRTTARKVTVTDSGFVLDVRAICYISDPSFEKWLTRTPFPKFHIPDRNGRFARAIAEGMEMYVEHDRPRQSDRWIIGYTLTSRTYPDLPQEHLPSKKEIEAFILDVLFMPLLRGNRPSELDHRLF
jgi:hypothetical protein